VLGNFYSPQLGATQLDAVEWEVRYWTKRQIVGFPPSLTWEFHYNIPDKNSSVEYSITLPSVIVKRIQLMDGLVCAG